MKPPFRASLPLDLAHAGHPRLDDAAEDVEAHQIADVDAEALVDALLDRDLELGASAGSGGCPSRTRPSSKRLVRLEVIAVGDHVLARRAPPRPRTSCIVLEIDVAAAHPVTRARSTGISRGSPIARVAEERRARRRPDPAGCRSGTCPRRRAAARRRTARAGSPAARARRGRRSCRGRRRAG